jgi:phytoene synthase
MRPHIAAIYAFARIADDFADEGDAQPTERIRRLDDWEARVRVAGGGRAPAPAGDDGDAVFTALALTIPSCGLDVQPFVDLLSAFRQDVRVTRYADWTELLEYCRRSANPVGRLVLGVAGIREAQAAASSDSLCTALQLTNFWQDLERDWQKGRLYVPASILGSAGAAEADLARHELTQAWRDALREASQRTRACFAQGRPIADMTRGRLRWELRATWLGGMRILDRLEAVGYDVFSHRPSLGWRDVPSIAWRTIAWKSS